MTKIFKKSRSNSPLPPTPPPMSPLLLLFSSSPTPPLPPSLSYLLSVPSASRPASVNQSGPLDNRFSASLPETSNKSSYSCFNNRQICSSTEGRKNKNWNFPKRGERCCARNYNETENDALLHISEEFKPFQSNQL